MAPSSSHQGEPHRGHQGEPHRDYPGTLGRAGLGVGLGAVFGAGFGGADRGMSATGAPTCRLYPEGAGLMVDWRERAGIGGFSLGRRDMTPQLLPHRGQNRYMLGYRGGWGLGPAVGRGGANSLALRVGEFLRLRLAQVTFDPTQPPYDSVQIYGLEGEGSKAGSLSSLESEGERDVEKEEWWAGGLEEWGPPFRQLAELFREREREREGEREAEGADEKEAGETEKGKQKEEEKEEEKKEEEKEKAVEVGNNSENE